MRSETLPSTIFIATKSMPTQPLTYTVSRYLMACESRGDFKPFSACTTSLDGILQLRRCLLKIRTMCGLVRWLVDNTDDSLPARCELYPVTGSSCDSQYDSSADASFGGDGRLASSVLKWILRIAKLVTNQPS